MPRRVWRARTAWLADRTPAHGLALAESLQTVSPEGLPSV
jgi:hypothetical protein